MNMNVPNSVKYSIVRHTLRKTFKQNKALKKIPTNLTLHLAQRLQVYSFCLYKYLRKQPTHFTIKNLFNYN